MAYVGHVTRLPLARYGSAAVGAVLVLMLVLGIRASAEADAGATPITSCTHAAVMSAVEAGGSYAFECDGTIEVPDPYVVPAGRTVALDAGGRSVRFVGIDSDDRPQFARVEGGTLTLKKVAVANFIVTVSNGTHGADGAPGAPGGNGGTGGNGADARGGAMYIAAGSNVTLDQVIFDNNLVQAGLGGDGGAGGLGSSGADGADGGDGGANGNGGTAEGGAIFNEGRLTITSSTFDRNEARGGGGWGVGGAQNDGGDGGEGDVDGLGGNGGDGGATGISGDARGGAIYTTGQLAITGTTFSRSKAVGGTSTAGSGGNGGFGGGRGGNGGNGGPAGPPSTAMGGAVYSTVPFTVGGGSTSENVVTATNTGAGGGGGGGDSYGPEGQNGASGGADRLATASHPDFYQPAPNAGLEVAITPVSSASAGAPFQITLTLTNTSAGERLEGITPAYPHGFGVANDYYPAGQRGEIGVVSGPTPAFPGTLGPGESSVHTITMKAIAPGKVGLEAKLAARGAGAGAEVSDTHYGEVEIAARQPLQAERTAMVAHGVALFLGNANRALRDQQARYARELFEALKSKLSTGARKFYFGSTKRLKVTELERALARWRGQSPDLTALVTPNRRKLYEGGSAYLTEQQFARYLEQENAAFRKQAAAFMGQKYKELAFELRYVAQLGSKEGWGQIGTDIALWRELNHQDGQYLLSAVGMAFDKEAGRRALADADASIKKGFGKVVDGLLQAREARVDKLAKLAESDPDKFIGQLAKDDAQLHHAAFKLLAEHLMGDVQDRLQGTLFTGAKAAVARLANAVGMANDKEARALARATKLGERSATLGPSYMDELSDEAKAMIDLRKMEAIGGMPTEDVEITKGILTSVNARLKQLGHNVEVEALFRPANPFKVPGAFAKVETVGVKNIAPIDLALGAPPSLLAETAIFKPTDPTRLPGFKGYSETEKILLQERYTVRLSEYNQFHGHEKVTDKKMKEMLKAFDRAHTFEDIGKGRTIKMKLSAEEVGGATVLKYDYLQVEGKVLINGKGKPVPIGTDYDGAALIDKNTRQPLKGQALSAAEFELKRQGEKAAVEKGYANPFHGFTAHGTDANAADYPDIVHYWLWHLKEADAIREAQRVVANYNRGKPAAQMTTVAKILSRAGGLFERHLLRVSASEASFGPANVLFRTPVVAPR
jgi:hypothetical protein